jgi:hypothetical protein
MGESKWGEMTDTLKTFQTIWQNGEPVEAAKTRARANLGAKRGLMRARMQPFGA